MRFFFTTALIAMASMASAESRFERFDRFYVGGGFTNVETNIDTINGPDARFTTLELKGGYKYSGYLSADVRLGFGLTDNTSATSDELTIDYHTSVYWRPETANEIAKLYGLFGFSAVSLSNGDNSSTESGLSFGGGVGFAIFENWNLNLEYRMILDTDEYDFSAFGANVDYRF